MPCLVELLSGIRITINLLSVSQRDSSSVLHFELQTVHLVVPRLAVWLYTIIVCVGFKNLVQLRSHLG